MGSPNTILAVSCSFSVCFLRCSFFLFVTSTCGQHIYWNICIFTDNVCVHWNSYFAQKSEKFTANGVSELSTYCADLEFHRLSDYFRENFYRQRNSLVVTVKEFVVHDKNNQRPSEKPREHCIVVSFLTSKRQQGISIGPELGHGTKDSKSNASTTTSTKWTTKGHPGRLCACNGTSLFYHTIR